MKMKCILIDDEQMALDTMINYLSKIREVEVLGMFDNALDAMPLINSGKVDVVFCDIQMPDINGISYFKSLKNPPVFIFVTADPNRAIESYELGVLDYIQKPFGVDRLLKSVNRAKAFWNQRNCHQMKGSFSSSRTGHQMLLSPTMRFSL